MTVWLGWQALRSVALFWTQPWQAWRKASKSMQQKEAHVAVVVLAEYSCPTVVRGAVRTRLVNKQLELGSLETNGKFPIPSMLAGGPVLDL